MTPAHRRLLEECRKTFSAVADNVRMVDLMHAEIDQVIPQIIAKLDAALTEQEPSGQHAEIAAEFLKVAGDAKLPVVVSLPPEWLRIAAAALVSKEPSGWVGVPPSATDRMCVNGAAIIQKALSQDWNDLELAASVYRAMLAAAPAALVEPSGWVSVEERLPEVGQDVLCWCGWAITGKYTWRGGWSTEDGANSIQMVTHWQLLPAAPAAKETK